MSPIRDALKSLSGGEGLEFWRELAGVLEDFLFNEVYVCVLLQPV